MAHQALLLRVTASLLCDREVCLPHDSEFCRGVGRSRDKLRDVSRHETVVTGGNAREPFLDNA